MQTPNNLAPLAAIIAARSPFALVLSGDALAPRFRHGDAVVVDPRGAPAPGDAVIVSLGGPHGGATAATIAAMIVNGDGDLYDHRGGHVPRGEYAVVGVVTKGYPSRVGT